MPAGTVRWFDPKRGEGRIVHANHDYPVDAGELEREARVPRARVRFDVRRDGEIARAVHARLIRGTRTGRRQGRFGDLVGAAYPDEKGRAPLTHHHPDLQVGVDHPLQVARRWVEALERGDVLGAVELYAPDAKLLLEGQTFAGRAEIQGCLGSRSILGTHPWNVEIQGDGDALVRWGSLDPDVPPGEARTRVAHGEIIEQRIRLGPHRD